MQNLTSSLYAVSALPNDVEYNVRVEARTSAMIHAYKTVLTARHYAIRSEFEHKLRDHKKVVRTRHAGAAEPQKPRWPVSSNLDQHTSSEMSQNTSDEHISSLWDDAVSSDDSDDSDDRMNSVEIRNEWKRIKKQMYTRIAPYLVTLRQNEELVMENMCLWMSQRDCATDGCDDSTSVLAVVDYEPVHATALFQLAWMIKQLEKHKMNTLIAHHASLVYGFACCTSAEDELVMADVEKNISKRELMSKSPKMIVSAILTTISTCINIELLPLPPNIHSNAHAKRTAVTSTLASLCDNMDRVLQLTPDVASPIRTTKPPRHSYEQSSKTTNPSPNQTDRGFGRNSPGGDTILPMMNPFQDGHIELLIESDRSGDRLAETQRSRIHHRRRSSSSFLHSPVLTHSAQNKTLKKSDSHENLNKPATKSEQSFTMQRLMRQESNAGLFSLIKKT